MMSLPAEKGDFDASFMLYNARHLHLKIAKIKNNTFRFNKPLKMPFCDYHVNCMSSKELNWVLTILSDGPDMLHKT